MARTPELMRLARAATFLGITRDTLRRWHLDGVGPPRSRIGKSYWYSREALKEWLRANAPAAASSAPQPAPPPRPVQRTFPASGARLAGQLR